MPSDTDIIIALAKKLQTQTTRDLEAENATLRRERDDARAQGISDLNRIHRHQATIRRLEEERDQLRAGQGTWPEGDDFPCCSGERVPRVVSAEELREGQVVAYDQLGFAGWATVKISARNLDTMRGYSGDLVLLADAPAKPVDTSTATLKETGENVARPEHEYRHFAPYGSTNALCDETVPRDVAWDLGKGEYADARFTTRGRETTCLDCRSKIKWLSDELPAPRLTAHALNVAPVGSRVTKPGRMPRMKLNDGYWFANWGHITPWSSEEMIRNGWANATLTHPGGCGNE